MIRELDDRHVAAQREDVGLAGWVTAGDEPTAGKDVRQDDHARAGEHGADSPDRRVAVVWRRVAVVGRNGNATERLPSAVGSTGVAGHLSEATGRGASSRRSDRAARRRGVGRW